MPPKTFLLSLFDTNEGIQGSSKRSRFGKGSLAGWVSVSATRDVTNSNDLQPRQSTSSLSGPFRASLDSQS